MKGIPFAEFHVNFCVEKSGNDGTNSALARSWLGWGKPLARPTKGCVVVLWRGSENGRQGHVGFFVRTVGTKIEILGGNHDDPQGDKVSIARFPKSRLLGYRKL